MAVPQFVFLTHLGRCLQLARVNSSSTRNKMRPEMRRVQTRERERERKLPERGELGEEERVLLERHERELVEHPVAGTKDHRDRRRRNNFRRLLLPPIHL